MKQTQYCRTNLLLLSLCLFMKASIWGLEPGANVFTSQDVGSPTTPGTASVSGTGVSAVYTLTGQGYFSGSSDSGHVYYQPLSGDGTLIAEVTSLTGAASASSNAGIMIRASNAWNSAMIYVDVSKSNGLNTTLRTTTGGATTNTSSVGSAPYWLKVVRSGASFSGYISSNGTTWTQLGTTTTMSWPDTVDIGLAATSNGSDVVTAAFTNVTLTPSNILGNTSSSSVTGGIWQGCGLEAEYFNGSNLEASTPFPTQLVMTRVDPTVQFSWTGTPGPAISSTTGFSVRWSGQVTPRYTENYTFSTANNGSVRVWVYKLPIYGGETTTPIIDSWPGDTGVASPSAAIAMTAGTPYHIQVEYTTGSTPPSNPNVSLSWSSTNQTSEVIPMQQLLPAYGGKGRSLAERWLNRTETTYASFLTAVNAAGSSTPYPDNPTGRRFITSLSSGSNAGTITSGYAERISGYLYPPVNGTYNFYLTGHNDSQFLICSEAGTLGSPLCSVAANSSTDAQFSPDNTNSNTMYMFAGQRYYYEIHHMATASAKDDCALGWGVAGGAGAEKPMPGNRVSPLEPVMSIPATGHYVDYLASGHPRLFTDAQGFVELAAQANSTGTQQNIWYAGAGGTVASAHSLGSPTSSSIPSILYVANWLFSQPPSPAVSGGNDLDQARQVLSRVSTLGMAYQISGNYYYLHRAMEELDLVAGQTVSYTPGGDTYGDTWTYSGGTSVPGWPANGWISGGNDLIIGEMTNTFAIGYDWFYNGLDTNDRSVLKGQVVAGLNAANTQYAASASIYTGPSNHSSVDAGGALTGALSIVNDPANSSSDNTACTSAIANAVAALSLNPAGGGPLSFLGPDGLNPESPDYTMYLMSYLGYGLSALDAANGGDMGLAQMPGQSKLGTYSVGIMGSVSMFNYNDAWYFGNDSFSPAEFWYDWKFNQTFDAWSETQTATNLAQNVGSGPIYNSVSAFDLLWYDPRGSLSTNGGASATSSPTNSGAPLDTQYRSTDIMVFRTGFTTNDLFAAIKGGDNTSGHPHLQQGEFIVQANGVEWASILGGDYDAYATGTYWHTDPNDPSGNDRWQYYKTRAEGSNTLVIGPNPTDQGEPDQNCGVTDSNTPTAILPQSKVIKYHSTSTLGDTVLNMSALYPHATQVLRGLQFNRPTTGPAYVIVQDEITAATGTSLNWYMHYDTNSGHTNVTMTTSGNAATETCNGQTMTLKILSPTGATFTKMNAAPQNASLNPPGQDTTISTNWHKLGIIIPSSSTATTTICVEMVPGSTLPSYTVQPLAGWQ